MGIINAKDGTKLFYKDWGSGPALVFSHGWPLNSDAWEDQMLALASKGFRCIAHDRRGHGRSEQTWQGNDMNTFADDLATVIETLDVREITLVGHSMGCGEVARYIGGHGTQRVSKTILIGTVTPFLLSADAAEMEVFAQMRSGITKDRAQFFEETAKKFYGANKLLSGVSHGVLETFSYHAMQASIKSVYDCVQAFSETDFTADLQKFDIPTLIIHGDADQMIPIELSAERTAALIPGSRLSIYEGAPHGLCSTHKEYVNDDIYAFARSHEVATVR